MKVKRVIQEEKFRPVTIELTFESEEELIYLGRLLGNMSPHDTDKITGLKEPFDMIGTIYNSLKDLY